MTCPCSGLQQIQNPRPRAQKGFEQDALVISGPAGLSVAETGALAGNRDLDIRRRSRVPTRLAAKRYANLPLRSSRRKRPSSSRRPADSNPIAHSPTTRYSLLITLSSAALSRACRSGRYCETRTVLAWQRRGPAPSGPSGPSGPAPGPAQRTRPSGPAPETLFPQRYRWLPTSRVLTSLPVSFATAVYRDCV